MRKQNSIIRILVFVFAALIALLVIGGGIYLFAASRSLKTLELKPDFAETSLEVGTQYTFSIKTTPSSASIKKAECVVDDPTSSFEINSSGKAVLTTGMNEGNVTVYVECKGIKSQVLTYSIVDSVARAQAEAAAQAEAQKQAEEEAAAQAEEEAAAAVKKYVKSTGDDVNVRSTNSTDGDVLGKAKKGDMFEKVEDVEDWTHIIYKGQDGYMKTEFLTEISEEEYNEGPTEDTTANTEEEKEEKKIQTKEEADAKVKADTENANADAAAPDAAAPDATATTPAIDPDAVAAALAAAGGHSYGGHTFTQSEWNYLLSKWEYTGDAAEMITHHSAADLIQLLDFDNPPGVIRSN